MKMDEYRARLAEIRKPAKYHAKRTIVDGITFMSKREADRYEQLKLLVRFGDVRDLRLQPRFDLHAPNGEKITTYSADFQYLDREGNCVIEDVKGARKGKAWEMHCLKRKWMKAEYNIDIVEI